jgi:hypothetical protein
MGESISVVIVAAAFAACIIWMVGAWRRRRRRDGRLLPPQPDPARRGEELLTVTDLRYVATTMHRKPLERLAIGALAYPGLADVSVYRGGVALRVAGEEEVFLEATRILGAGTATWAVGRAVEKEGLIVLEWRCGDDVTIADSYLRAPTPGDDGRIIGTMRAIARGAGPAGQTNVRSTNSEESSEHQHG